MKSGALITSLILVAVLALSQAFVRGIPAPKGRELVQWQSLEDLGQAPHESPVLLEFSAEWCGPCRRMQVTTFREPEFAVFLASQNLRPVRVDFADVSPETWTRTMKTYGVVGLPAIVVINADGRFGRPIVGATSTAQLKWAIERKLASNREQLFWKSPDDPPESGKLQILYFDKQWFLTRNDRSDWVEKPSGDLVEWSKNFQLVDDNVFGFSNGSRHYRANKVRTVPTLLVLGMDGREIARFEGTDAVNEAPGEISRRAREMGIDVLAPERPYADAGSD